MSKTVAKYQKYAEYKDSGVEWLGVIPSHWKVSKFAYVINTVGDIDHYMPDSVDIGIPYIMTGDLQENVSEIDLTNCKQVSQEAFQRLSKKIKTSKDDVILARYATIGTASYVDIDADFLVSYSCVTIKPKRSKTTGKYLFCYLKSDAFLQAIQMQVNSNTQGNVGVDSLRAVKVIIPPLEEQKVIINFLDHETAKIDCLITKQEKLIELLKEKRQAVISHAVTKGLNLDVKMKDSGVEWLGQVPEHWTVKSYRHASKIYRGKFGHRPRNDPAFYDGEYPFIQTGDVARAGKYITSYSQTLNEKGKEVSQLFPKGTLMMAIAANIGDLAILGFEAYAPDSVVGFKPNQDIDLEFLRYSFMAALPALEQTSTQSTQANLNVERIGAVQGVFPSLNDQQEIVSYLDDMLNKYSVIEREMHKAIELLQERRTALISSAVTGKIDVRHWQNPNHNNNEANTELGA